MLDRELDIYKSIGSKRAQSNQVLDLRSAVLRVGNVPEELNELMLKVHFQNFGEVASVDVQKQYAFVKFKNRLDAEEALRTGANFPSIGDGNHRFTLAITDKV